MSDKPPMMMQMLASMVGIPPEEFQKTIEQFINTAQNLGAQNKRIEYNLVQVLKELNRTKDTATPFIQYYDLEGKLVVGE